MLLKKDSLQHTFEGGGYKCFQKFITVDQP